MSASPHSLVTTRDARDGRGFFRIIERVRAAFSSIYKPAFLANPPTDKVLEIGPGTGSLTVRILEKAKHCVVVEMDPRMAVELAKRVQGKCVLCSWFTWPLPSFVCWLEQRRLEIIIGNFVKAELPYFDVRLSNSPYQISSPLVALPPPALLGRDPDVLARV